MINEVKTAIKRNARVHRKWVVRGCILEERGHIRSVQNETNRIIKKAKNKYFLNLGEKLSSYGTGSKSFWTTFQRLVNMKKITNIPPLAEGNKTISDFWQKTNIFNDYFCNQCSLNYTSSTLPPLRLNTVSLLFNINTSEEKISRIILSLSSKKAHGCDGISIILKICAPVVAKPLNLIFTKSLWEGKFPNDWKFANVQPVCKKDSREIKSNYRPISLLPVCGKILEMIVYDDHISSQ